MVYKAIVALGLGGILCGGCGTYRNAVEIEPAKSETKHIYFNPEATSPVKHLFHDDGDSTCIGPPHNINRGTRSPVKHVRYSRD